MSDKEEEITYQGKVNKDNRKKGAIRKYLNSLDFKKRVEKEMEKEKEKND